MKKKQFKENSFRVYTFVAEVFDGLEDIFIDEIKKITGGRADIVRKEKGLVYFNTKFNLEKFYEIRTAASLYINHPINSKLSMPENMKSILSDVKKIIFENNSLYGENVFETLKVTAKGAASPEFLILKRFLSQNAKLDLVFKGGDLVIKRMDNSKDLLIRVTPRPLSVRYWRDSNYKAAINATIAASMAFITNPQKYDKVLNICAGSGTLLIERCLTNPAPLSAIGFEIENEVVQYAKRNLKTSELPKKYKIEQGDCTKLSSYLSSEEKFNVVLGDLPFGLAVGSVPENKILYRKLLVELTKVCEKNARICLITYDVQNLNIALSELKDQFQIIRTYQTKLSTNKDGVYLFPIIYLIALM